MSKVEREVTSRGVISRHGPQNLFIRRKAEGRSPDLQQADLYSYILPEHYRCNPLCAITVLPCHGIYVQLAHLQVMPTEAKLLTQPCGNDCPHQVRISSAGRNSWTTTR